MLIYAIDVGVLHLGIALVAYSGDAEGEGMEPVEVIAADTVDVTNFNCDRATCRLKHDRVMSDWIGHFVEEYRDLYAFADVVLIERQPPGGHRCVEQLLMHHYRDKAALVHPRTMHAHFGVGALDYEGRKVALTRIAKSLFAHSECATRALHTQRAHDVADALLFTVLHARKLQRRRPAAIISAVADDGATAGIMAADRCPLDAATACFEQYLYHKPESRHGVA